MYGYTEEEFLNLNFNAIDMMTDNTSFIRPIVTDKIKNHSLQIAQNHRKKNGDKIDLLIVSQLFEEAGEKYLMIVGNDITERNLNLKSLKEQNEKLKEIAWIQSHIVRAPLARIMGLIHIINDVTTSLEEKTDMLKHVLSSAHELDEIIKDIVLKSQKIELSAYD